MGYETLGLISKYIQWALWIAIAAITLRVAYIAYTYYITVEDVSFKSVIEKIKKYITAVVICVCASGIVEFIKSYYF